MDTNNTPVENQENINTNPADEAQADNENTTAEELLEEEEKEKKPGRSIWFRILMILLLIVIIVIGTLFVTVWIVDDFDNVGQLIRYIFDQI